MSRSWRRYDIDKLIVELVVLKQTCNSDYILASKLYKALRKAEIIDPERTSKRSPIINP